MEAIVPEFRFNERYRILKGAEFFIDGWLHFNEPYHACDGTYKTMGTGYSTNTVTYANSPNNLAIALTRVTGAREPSVPGFDNQLRENQRLFIQMSADFLTFVANEYAPFFDDYKGAQIEAQEHHADPHEKRALRIQGYGEIAEGKWCLITTPAILKIKYKIKTKEFAKDRKKPRAIGDLGVVASLLGFRLTYFLKIAQSSVDLDVLQGMARFVKSPRPSDLHSAFDLLIDPPGPAFFCYFSDDSSLSIRFPGGLHRFNLDIKSCDCSHTQSLFDALVSLFPAGEARDDAVRVVEQCRMPVQLDCPGNTEKKVLLQAIEAVLYSGSTLTTAINNLANLLIFKAIMARGYTGRLNAEGIATELVEAAAFVGYQITGATPLQSIEEIQFLKHSPVKDTNGVYRPQINLGVLLRSLGSAQGDFPGRGPLGPRISEFTAQVIHSMFPRTSNVVVDALRLAFPRNRECTKEEASRLTALTSFKVEIDDTYPTFYASTESIARRYKLADDDIVELAVASRELKPGVFLSSETVDRILLTDYDITPVDLSSLPPASFVNIDHAVDGGHNL